MKKALAVALVVLLAAAPAAAQEQPPLVLDTPAGPGPVTPGARVRLTQSNGGTLVGYVAGTNARGLVIALPGENPVAQGTRVEVPFASLSRMEVSLGKRNHLWIGALAGAVAFGAIGVTEPVAECDDNPYTTETVACSRAEAIVIGALAGALIGGTIGFFVKHERWAPVALEAVGAPRDVSRAPEPVATTAGITVRF
jgi:uncharacterized membrane protein